MYLPFVNLGAESLPDSFDAHGVETLCDIVAILLLTLQNPRIIINRGEKLCIGWSDTILVMMEV